jgi:hypothetical protein
MPDISCVAYDVLVSQEGLLHGVSLYYYKQIYNKSVQATECLASQISNDN